MQPIRQITEHPPKRNKPKPWVLTYVLVPRFPTHIRTRTGEVTENFIKPITIKDRYPTEKSAQQALEAVQRGKGMWRKEMWGLREWRIEKL